MIVTEGTQPSGPPASRLRISQDEKAQINRGDDHVFAMIVELPIRWSAGAL
ncbi:hypothetical protein ACWDKQ_17250 [Saccharopolyspora sp. NPDC000995]